MALNPLLSLIGRLVARSDRKRGNRQTDRQTDRQTTFSGTPGVVPDMAGKLPIDFFHLMFDDRVLDLLLTETTRYADQYLEREKEHLDQHPQARAHDWQRAPLSLKELEVFLALLLAMGVCGFPIMR